jgi:hypothetical protein
LVTLVIAQVMGVTELVNLFAPLVIFGATEAIKYLLPTISTKIPGWLVISFIVPALAAILALLLPNPALGFWLQVGYGLLAVFIREVITQFQNLFGTSKSK